jgi:hypothetical protein
MLQNSNALTNYTAISKDYSCYHQHAWFENTNLYYSSYFESYTDVLFSKLSNDTSSRRRLDSAEGWDIESFDKKKVTIDAGKKHLLGNQYFL